MNTNFDFSKFKNKANWKRVVVFFLSMVLLLTGIVIPDFPLYGSMTAHASASGDARGDYYKQDSFPISYLEQEEIHTITAEGKLGPINAVTWYQFTPSETADYAFWGSSADNSYLDTYGSVYTKNTAEGCYELLISNDDWKDGHFRIHTTLNAGTTYFLCAGYYNYNTTGEYEPSFCKSYIADVHAKINGVEKSYLSTKYGKSYILEADATCVNGATPTYEWYTLDENNAKKVLPGTGSTYTYTESGTTESSTHIFCTVTAGTESMTVDFNMYFLPFNVNISIDGDNTASIDYQMNHTYTIQAKTFSAAGSKLTYKWRLDDKVLQTGNSDTLSFRPTTEILGDNYQSFYLLCDITDENGCQTTS